MSGMDTPDLPAYPFTAAMGRDLGLDADTLFRLVRSGVLRHPVRDVYVPAALPDDIALRCRALGLVLPPDAFLCDRTAAWLHAGDRALAPNEHLEVPVISCFRPSDGGRLRNKLVDSGEREISTRDLMTVEGLPVTTPLRTALDLGRLQPSPDLKLHGMDSMLALGAFSHDELLGEVPRFNRRRGVVQLRELAPLADGGSESFGETALRRRWHGAGLPWPQTQVSIVVDGREVARLDLGLEDLLFASEYDGERWHGVDRSAHDDGRREWLTRTRAWHIEVFRKGDVFGPRQRVESRLRTGYETRRARLGLRPAYLL